jgi:ABC-type oligopeptide transport system substrate-binding subunit/class 3 adenylate cyclase
MQCPSCKTENPEQAKFCLNCGAELTLVCPQCGTELPVHARFCFACGAEVGPPQPAVTPWDTVAERLRRLVPKQFAERLLATRGQVGKERRIVTILFSDVESSTPMAEKLDPEEWTEIMDGAFDVLIEPIYRYEGTLARLMGDAILAFFGAPVAHEDDPERACRAALDIIEGAKRYARHLEEERGITGFDVRVGINTGLVVVGEVGSDLRVEYTAMGDAINLAARIESAAEPGTLLIAGDTHKLLAHLFDTEALGPIEVKGKTEPVSVYRVLAPKPLPDRLWGIAGLGSPLVGREAEFSALLEALKRLQAGVGGIVTLVGEAGLGKSRLVAELRKRAVPSDMQWVEGRCLSYGTSIAYQLWLNVLRGLLGVTADAEPGAVRDTLRECVHVLCPERADDVYPYLARLMSPRPEPVEGPRPEPAEGPPLGAEHETSVRDLEGEKLKIATFRAVETLVQCAATNRPLVLVCEDLHWADPTSIDLLERLLSLSDHAALLLICVFRPQRELGSWHIRETAARLYAHRHTDLRLEPLSVSDSEALLSHLLRMPSLLKTFQERVLSYAEGNPFYVEEIIRSLIDSGAIVREEARRSWRVTQDVDELQIPDTLHGVLMARIDRLPEEAKRVLQMAAVIGRVFSYRLLAAIAQEESELEQHLLTLQREQMIRERARWPELEYIFKHHLTEEAAYNGLLKSRRRVIHRRVAETMEKLFSDRIEEQVGLLAHHWEGAEEPEKSVPYLLMAGDQVRALYSNAEAERLYQAAVKILRELGREELAAKTLMKLGLVYTAAFDPKKAREVYDEAFAIWQPLRESRDLAEQESPAAVLRLAVEEPLTLDPGMIGDDVSRFIVSQLFRGLVEVDPDCNVLPAVAARWEVADRGTRYVFRLRKGLRWNDGTPLTAGDFEYGWKRNLNPATRSPLAALLYVLKNAQAFGEGTISDPAMVGVRALDDCTLEVCLEAPTAYLPHLLAHDIAYPLPRWAIEGHAERWTDSGNLVSNGPYHLAEWERGKKLVLSRNPFYGGRCHGNIQRVQCRVFTDFGLALQAYASDVVDAVSMIAADPATTARARATHGREFILIPRLLTFYLMFRTDRPPFDDARVRRALVHAVDRQALAKEAFQGQRLPGAGGFVPPDMPGHSPHIGLAYDPDQARRLLAQAGYPNGQAFPRVTWLHPRGSPGEPVVPFLRKAWHEGLGLNLEPGSLEWGAFRDRVDRDPAHLTLLAWSADYPDPDNWLRVNFHSTQGMNRPRWHNARFDALVEEAARVSDQARRMELYREADRILVAEEVVIMPLSYGRGRMLAKPWVTLPRMAPVPLRLKDVVVDRRNT